MDIGAEMVKFALILYFFVSLLDLGSLKKSSGKMEMGKNIQPISRLATRAPSSRALK